MNVLDWLRPKSPEQRRKGFRVILGGQIESPVLPSEAKRRVQFLRPVLWDAENLLNKCEAVFRLPIKIGGPEQKAVSDFKKGCRSEEGVCEILISSDVHPDASRELFLAYLTTLVNLRNKAVQIRGNLHAIKTNDAEILEYALQDLISSLADRNLISYDFNSIRSSLKVAMQKLGV